MNIYGQIVNPITGIKVSIFGKLGQKVLANYLDTHINQFGGRPSRGAWNEVGENVIKVLNTEDQHWKDRVNPTNPTNAPCTNRSYDGMDGRQNKRHKQFRTKDPKMLNFYQEWHVERLRDTYRMLQYFKNGTNGNPPGCGLDDKTAEKATELWAKSLDHYFKAANPLSNRGPQYKKWGERRLRELEYLLIDNKPADWGDDKIRAMLWTTLNLENLGIELRKEYTKTKRNI